MNDPRYALSRHPVAAALTTHAPVPHLPDRNAPDRTAAGAARRSARNKPLMRRFEAIARDTAGQERHVAALAPAIPVFEQAFAAFARGTQIATPSGPVAIEDLGPGDLVQTAEQGPQPVLWIGTITLYPAAVAAAPDAPGLLRLTAGCFGPGRPVDDMVLGPYARIARHASRAAARFGGDEVFVPAADLQDGTSVIGLRPVAPVQVHHLALDGHATIRAGGLDVESFHPGCLTDTLDAEMQALFLSLFPHVRQLADFGPLCHPQRPYAFERAGDAD